MDKKKPVPVMKFNGGYCGNLAVDQLDNSQASDLDNIVVVPGGTGIRSRLGNSKLNATVMNSGANVQGISYLLQADQDLWLVTVCGSKFFTSSNISGTMTDSTGSYSGITAGASNKWDLFTFQDSIVGFGGPVTTPDAPITWTGSGNVAALGGTSPSAYGGFTANNRVFAFRTSANPSTIYWSIIGLATDWTGSGSGSAVVGSFSDNQRVTAACVISTNYVLVFKENSTYQMVISSAPFPIYSLFDNVGCVGKNAVVNIDGEVFFISPRKKMYSTNGEVFKEYPKSADDLWATVDSSTLANTEGFRQKGTDYDWIVWLVSISGNKRAIIWDLENKCWLRCTTGYNVNTTGIDNQQRIYMGGTDGFIYLPAQAATYADASESSPGTIAAFWRSGWINPANSEEGVQIGKITANYRTKASGSITVNYGFDFIADSKSFTLSQTATSSEVLTSRSSVLTGRGNYFQFKVGISSSTIDMGLSSLTMYGKVYGQKRISAS
jgi:hypothetical protein